MDQKGSEPRQMIQFPENESKKPPERCATIKSILHETRVFPPDEAFVKQANLSGIGAYRASALKPKRTSPLSGQAGAGNYHLA